MDAKSLIILICFCVLILCFNPFVEGDIHFGLCVDPTCSVPIGKGTTTLTYTSPDDQRISVVANEEVLIYVKGYGPKKDLLGILVRGNRGYISKQFVRETSTFVKLLVPANLEFRTSHLVTSSAATASHLHTSPQYHASSRLQHLVEHNGPEVPIHTQSNGRFPEDFQSQATIHDSLSPQLHPSQQVHPSIQAQPPNSHMNDFPDSSSISDSDYDYFYFNSPEPMGADDYLSQNVPNMKSDDYSSPLHGTLNSISNTEGSIPQHLRTSNMKHPHTIPPSGSNMHSLHSSESMQQQHFASPQNLHPSQNQHFLSVQNQKQYPSMQQVQFEASQNILRQNQHPSPTLSQELVRPSTSMQQRSMHPAQNQQQNVPTANLQQQNPGMQQSVHHEPQLQQKPNTEHHSSHQQLQYSQEVPNIPSKMTQNSLDSIDADYLVGDEFSKTMALVEQWEKNSVYSDSKSIPPASSQNVKLDSSQSQPFSSQSAHVTDSSSSMKVTTVQDEVQSSEVLEENMDNIDTSTEELNESDDYSDLYHDIVDEDDRDVKNLSSKGNVDDNNMVLETSINEASETEGSSALSDLQSSVPEAFTSTDIPLEKPIVSETPQEISKPEIDQKYSESNYLNPDDINRNLTEHVDKMFTTNPNVTNEHLNSISHHSLSEGKKLHEEDKFSNVLDRNNNNAEHSEIESLKQDPISQLSEILTESDQKSELNQFHNAPKTDMLEDLTTYQGRNLKGESTTTEETPDTDVVHDDNITQSEADIFTSFENWLNALKTMLNSFISWFPEPLYSAIMDLQNKGISPRVPVFTAICGIIIILLIVPLYFIKEHSKETKLSSQLAHVEKDAYTLSATNSVLEAKLQSAQCLLETYEKAIEEEKVGAMKIKMEYEDLAEYLENTKAELEHCYEEIESLKGKENDYLSLLSDNAKEKKELNEQKDCLEKLVKENEDTISSLTDQLSETENNLKQLETEKTQYMQLKDDYEEKLSQFERNCNQLLQEAEVWNLRVNELTVKVNEERALKEESEATLKEKDEEIESLRQLVETFKSFEEMEDSEEKEKTKEEKLQILLKSSMILNQLEKQVQETKLLSEQLEKEKNKILDMEVELLEARSEIDKLKISYNQALQDKAEAQTKLDVLTNYFKDKEIQLQRQLGAQEAVRQKKEEDASSAERRIILIEQENASYKYQVASMKQEMEETERNLKSQIAAQEKKAHENWIAARAAERKLEETKQEITQLHQRLTLLERERQNWEREEIIRPVPKRANEEVGSQDMNISDRSIFSAPHERPPPPPHMLLPLDRPLPPPFPHPSTMFMPPMDRHFRLPPPWHLPPDPSSDFRSTPPEFLPGRESTPPRRPFPLNDTDAGPHASSPLTIDARDSRNSTPPHLLPDFHDIPPQPGRPPFYPPPPPHRLHMHPPFRRDMGPGPKRLENPNELNPRNSQHPPPPSQEQWQHSRV